MVKPVRRIVTGHNAAGQAIIANDGSPSRVFDQLGEPGLVFHEVWHTSAAPTRIAASGVEPIETKLTLPPPKHGTRIRVLDIPPESHETLQLDAETAKSHFEQIGGGSAHSSNSRHPYMHRTETVDYGIVLEGEIVLIMDEGETLVRQGDIVIQQGTNHAWSNRSGNNCRIAFILVDGQFDETLKG